jgi:hypothetical protein
LNKGPAKYQTKNYLDLMVLALITLYGLFFVPYDNHYSFSTLVLTLFFFIALLIAVKKSPWLFVLTLLTWFLPFCQGYINYGLQDLLRAMLPIGLLIILNSLELKSILSVRTSEKVLIIFSIIITKYLLLIILEVLSEITNESSYLFSGPTRALINEPILVSYLVFGIWLFFNRPKFNFSRVLLGYIYLITITIGILSVWFQIRYLVLSFVLTILLLGNKKTKILIILFGLIVVSYMAKFHEVSLDNGKIDEIKQIYLLVGDEIWFGKSLGFLRELDGVLVRFTHSAFSIFYLYGGIVGLAWYIFMFFRFLGKCLPNFNHTSLIILLPIAHSQFVQSGYKMVGLLSIPFYFIIMRSICAKNAQK